MEHTGKHRFGRQSTVIKTAWNLLLKSCQSARVETEPEGWSQTECESVCVSASTCVSLCVCASACAPVCVCLCVYVCICVCACVCACPCFYVRVLSSSVHTVGNNVSTHTSQTPPTLYLFCWASVNLLLSQCSHITARALLQCTNVHFY